MHLSRRHKVPPAQLRQEPTWGRFPCSSRGLMLRGSDVENKAPSGALETTRSDSIVNVGDVGIEPAKIAIAFWTTLAQCGHRACFYHFEKIEPGRSAHF